MRPVAGWRRAFAAPLTWLGAWVLLLVASPAAADEDWSEPQAGPQTSGTATTTDRESSDEAGGDEDDREDDQESDGEDEDRETDGEATTNAGSETTTEVDSEEDDVPSAKVGGGENKPDKTWALTVEGFTEIPFQIGLAGVIETAGPFRVRGGFGYLPSPFVRTANDVLVGMSGGYSQEDADLVESIVGDTMMWQVGGGLITGRNRGFYVNGGYSLVTFGGTATGSDILAATSDTQIPQRVRDEYGTFDLEIDSTLHQFDAELGVVWKLGGHIQLRTGLGWSFTFASSANVEASVDSANQQVQQGIDSLEQSAESYLNQTFRSYVHPPYLSLGFGFSLH